MPKQARRKLAVLEKCPTGIRGLDEITNGGLPRGRPTLVCGGAGCGKTLLGMEFMVRGIRDFGEPGVFVTFEETEDELVKNVASLGYDLHDLMHRNKLAIDHVYIERSEIEETGEYDLEGLFVRIGAMIDKVRAKRIVLDSLEALFGGLPNEAILRSELRRLFRWLKQRDMTAVITGEQGQNTLTRHGLEEYISDCVIFLDHRLVDQIATRRLRIVKYRGSSHGTNEYPTMIDEHGLSVLPISSLGLDYPVTKQRVSSGIHRLDTMLGGAGYFKASSIMVSGSAGTGKTSFAAAFANSTCLSGGRCLYFSFEESSEQIVRNMASIDFNLGRWVKSGLLRFHTVRPSAYGLETHLVNMTAAIEAFKPHSVIVDPVTDLANIGDNREVRAMLTRLIDFLKSSGITSIFTSLTRGDMPMESTEVGISFLIDTWLLLLMVESASERNRVVYVLKSRGMAHSNQMREYVLSDKGIDLVDVYTGSGQVFTGSARKVQELQDTEDASARALASEEKRHQLEHEDAAIEAQIRALHLKREGVRAEIRLVRSLEKAHEAAWKRDRTAMERIRSADRSEKG